MTIGQKKAFLINVFFVATIAVLGYFVIKYLFAWMFPFVLGLLVAISLQRPVDFLAKKTPVPRTFWAIFLVLVVVLILLILAIVAGQRLYVELMSFLKFLPTYAESISTLFADLSDRLSEFLTGMPDSLQKSIEDMPANLLNSFASSMSGWLTRIVNAVVQGGPAFIVTLVMSVVACCFVTKDYYLITGFLRRQLSPRQSDVVSESKTVFVSSILKMVRGYLLLMLITFVELAIGFSVLRVNYAIVVALLVSVVDVLPVLGTGTVLIPWSIISFLMGHYWQGLGLAVLYVAVLIIRNILEPRIIGKQVGLPPVVTLMAMYLGLQLFGLVGIFFVPVTVIVIKKLQESGKIRLWKSSGQEELS